MTAKMRKYHHEQDYELVNDLLFRTYEKIKYPNWLQPRWEYFHYHPNTEVSCYDTIGVWEDDGVIVGVVTHEGDLGEAFLHVDKNYPYLKREMFEYAINHLGKRTEEGKTRLKVHINDFDTELEDIASSFGFEKHMNPNWIPEICAFDIESQPIEIVIPEGYIVKDLSVDNDIRKFHRVMWRGFNHDGEAPEEGIEWRIKMQSAPNYNKKLNIVVEAPTGHYAAISGVWFDPINKVGYIEPVCTDPEYRRLGLGKAAVLECVRRCKELGAHTVYVESPLLFYKAAGFKKVFIRNEWHKEW